MSSSALRDVTVVGGAELPPHLLHCYPPGPNPAHPSPSAPSLPASVAKETGDAHRELLLLCRYPVPTFTIFWALIFKFMDNSVGVQGWGEGKSSPPRLLPSPALGHFAIREFEVWGSSAGFKAQHSWPCRDRRDSSPAGLSEESSLMTTTLTSTGTQLCQHNCSRAALCRGTLKNLHSE